MAAYLQNLRGDNPVAANLRDIPSFFARPARIFQAHERSSWRPDIIAGLTVAVVLLPQAIAYALIAELPPEMGLYTAIIGAIIGALWGSSNHLQTGPTNAISLLVLSTLLTVSPAGPAEYVILAGLLAVMVGVFQLGLGLARLGVLVNFVSHSVIVGFSAGAGVLIAIRQIRPLLGLNFTSHSFVETLTGAGGELIAGNVNWPTAALGLGTMLLIVLTKRLNPKLPGPLIGMVVAAVVVALFGLDRDGVDVIGELPRGLPPLTKLPLFDFDLISELSTGALAIAAIGLIEAMSIARTISNQSDQRLNSNQEFVGQGLANITSGFFSGYACSGSFTRSAVNYEAGARTPLASALSGLFVLVAMNVFAPFAAFVPRSALAAVLIVIAVGMIDREEIMRILRGAPGDAVIMIVTFLGTLFLHLEFAVLVGILLSFAVYIVKTSVPKVVPVVPDENFKHFNPQNSKAPCPQLAIIDISGDLYFGAVSHIDTTISRHRHRHPDQRFLLLRMHSVNQCDFSGIHALESVVRTYRDQGGDVFMVRVRDHILSFMQSTGFYDRLGEDHFLSEDRAVSYLFHKIIDPAICIYECEVKIYKECQNLPKQIYRGQIPLHTDIPKESVVSTTPRDLWTQLHDDRPPLVIDVREVREFRRGHVPAAILMPLPKLLLDGAELPFDRHIVFVCRGGRRSTRAAYMLHSRGYENVSVLQGGMLAWEAAGLLEAIDK
jgi:SulP family sulfate permease